MAKDLAGFEGKATCYLKGKENRVDGSGTTMMCSVVLLHFFFQPSKSGPSSAKMKDLVYHLLVDCPGTTLSVHFGVLVEVEIQVP